MSDVDVRVCCMVVCVGVCVRTNFLILRKNLAQQAEDRWKKLKKSRVCFLCVFVCVTSFVYSIFTWYHTTVNTRLLASVQRRLPLSVLLLILLTQELSACISSRSRRNHLALSHPRAAAAAVHYNIYVTAPILLMMFHLYIATGITSRLISGSPFLVLLFFCVFSFQLESLSDSVLAFCCLPLYLYCSLSHQGNFYLCQFLHVCGVCFPDCIYACVRSSVPVCAVCVCVPCVSVCVYIVCVCIVCVLCVCVCFLYDSLSTCFALSTETASS